MQEKAKIFLSSERGCTETEWFRSYNTFNFGNYKNENKAPCGSLYVLNDDTLAGKKSLRLFIEHNSLHVTVPVVGAVSYTDSLGNRSTINTGEIQINILPAEATVEVSNPYESELVNFLQFWIKNGTAKLKQSIISSFDANKKNCLEQIAAHNEVKFSIGKFDGRKEGTYRPASLKNKVFVFIIQGAFEVQNRLLETKDGLSLSNTDEIEFEALSNEAIIIIVETPSDPIY